MDIALEVFQAPFGTHVPTRGSFVRESPGWYQVISPGARSPSSNEVIHSAVSEAGIESKIAGTIREYDDLGTAFKWCTSPFTRPLDTVARLERRGFASWEARGMFAPIRDLAIAAPEGATYEALNRGNLDEYVLTNLRGWLIEREPEAGEIASLREDLEWLLDNRPTSARFTLARVNGEPAATAGFHLKRGLAYFVGGNVLKRFRGAGLYRGLLRQRIAICRELGVPLIATIARERTSAPILEKLGFQTAYRARIFQYGGTPPE